MKIYIAASFPRKDSAIMLAETLREAGHSITSRWLTDVNAVYAGSDSEYDSARKFSVVDAADVASADIICQITGDQETRGGRHVETGLAIAWEKPILLLGPHENVFHYHPLVQSFENVDEILRFLAKRVPLLAKNREEADYTNRE